MIIVWIIAIALAVGVIAVLVDAIGKKDSKHKPYGPYERFVKRGLDAFLATGALIVLSPVLLVTAVLVRVKLGSPVLFIQERPGRNGKIFKLYKFRTMTDARDENGELLPDDQRLPAFGQKLRSTSLDELPELINMIKGDMAVVGPRPLLVRYLPRYNAHQATSIGEAFANCDAITGLAMGALYTIGFLALLYLPRKIVTPKQFLDGLVEGFKNMVPATLILVFAWTLSGICGADYLNAGGFVANMVEKYSVSLSFMPALFFVVALLLAFSTGTSWGTFGITMTDLTVQANSW